MGAGQSIRFDASGLDATLNYLGHRTSDNFRALVESRGNEFAYMHYQWSNMDERTTAEEFWRRILNKIPDGSVAAYNATEVKNYLLAQSQSQWLPGVLEYLPSGHIFDATVYLNLGYDNIAFGCNVALNLDHAPFHVDHREAVYYLMHELAHAGYLSYHGMPDLTVPRTLGELAGNVMFLTHLEGMGVLTPLRLRTEESGLGDPDYIVLADVAERERRVRAYFMKLSRLDPDKPAKTEDLGIYGHFSDRPLRLWYIAGCYMAQSIEAALGKDKLRELVRIGRGAFFDAYGGLHDPMLV